MSHPANPAGSAIVVGGGIGAGKSSVLEVFGQAGFVLIQADAVGHEILSPDHEAGRAVAHRWPSVVVDGQVSRPKLAAIVFSDPEALRELEEITHPAIRSEIVRRVQAANAPVAIEIPILGMFGDSAWHRIAIVAPADIRLARAAARGGNPDDIKARMAAQPSEEVWAVWADTIVDNGGSWDETRHALEPFVGLEADE
jgi:dephospho-CoA kinase